MLLHDGLLSSMSVTHDGIVLLLNCYSNTNKLFYEYLKLLKETSEDISDTWKH